MTITTRSNARHFLYDHPVIGPELGFYGTAYEVTPTRLTDPNHFGTFRGQNQYLRRARIILPNRSGYDREKGAGVAYPSQAQIAHGDQTNWTGPSWPNEPYEVIFGGVDPEGALTFDRINLACKRALRRVMFDTWTPRSPWVDTAGHENGDFAYGVTDWTASAAGVGINADATGDTNESGFASLLLNFVSATPYVYHSRGIAVQPGEQVYLAANIIVIQGGPLTWQVWEQDPTTAAWNQALGQTITVQGVGSKLHIEQVYGALTTTYKLNVRLAGAAGTIVAIDNLAGHKLSDTYWKTPSWALANWQLQGLLWADYGAQLGAYTYAMGAKRYTALQRGTQWTPENLDEEVNPRALQIIDPMLRQLPQRELWYAGKRPEGDKVTWDDDASTYGGDQDFLVAALEAEAYEMLEARDQLGANGKWLRGLRDAEVTLAAQRASRKQPAMARNPVRHRSVV